MHSISPNNNLACGTQYNPLFILSFRCARPGPGDWCYPLCPPGQWLYRHKSCNGINHVIKFELQSIQSCHKRTSTHLLTFCAPGFQPRTLLLLPATHHLLVRPRRHLEQLRAREHNRRPEQVDNAPLMLLVITYSRNFLGMMPQFV